MNIITSYFDNIFDELIRHLIFFYIQKKNPRAGFQPRISQTRSRASTTRPPCSPRVFETLSICTKFLPRIRGASQSEWPAHKEVLKRMDPIWGLQATLEPA